MGDIVTVVDLASALQSEVINSVGDLLIDLAEGLVKPVVASQVTAAPWPAVVTATVLAAAGRPYRNPKAQSAKTVDATRDDYNPEEMGVYLTDSEKKRLAEWVASQTAEEASGAPQGAFPAPLCYPDPARPVWGTRGSVFTDWE